MSIYVPSNGPDAWRSLLADPARHWRAGYSAQTLARCWEAANGLPPEIQAMFGASARLLIAIPEHKVALPGGGRDSQNDLFALIRLEDALCACTIEGKVEEPFDKTIAEWLEGASDGKRRRLDFLCLLLGLAQPLPGSLRYQLLHRTASAILEARRFKAWQAAMIVHSFSPTMRWFDDFADFASLFGLSARPGEAAGLRLPDGSLLKLGWACGDPRFLADELSPGAGPA
jgi:hypothetical protein